MLESILLNNKVKLPYYIYTCRLIFITKTSLDDLEKFTPPNV